MQHDFGQLVRAPSSLLLPKSQRRCKTVEITNQLDAARNQWAAFSCSTRAGGGAITCWLPRRRSFSSFPVFENPTSELPMTTAVTRAASPLPTNSAESCFPLSVASARGFSEKERKGKKEKGKTTTKMTRTKSPLHSLSRRQKERLIFSARFQIMKGRTSAGRCGSLSSS